MGGQRRGNHLQREAAELEPAARGLHCLPVAAGVDCSIGGFTQGLLWGVIWRHWGVNNSLMGR